MPEIEIWKVFASLGVPGLALGILYMLFRQFKWKFPQVPRQWVGPLIVLFMILTSGVIFYVLTLWAPRSDASIVRVAILGSNKMPIEDAEVWSSIGGEAKKVAGGWELEIPSGKLPDDLKIIVFAAEKQAHLKGQHETIVNKGRTTAITIQLARDTSAQVHGTVSDAAGRPVAGALVSIAGSAGSTTTDAQGYFLLTVNAAEGEEVRLRAMKPGYEILDQYHPAGDSSAYLILRKEP